MRHAEMNAFRPALRRGFTLVELLIAIIIAGILVSMAVVRAGGPKTRAYIAAMQEDLRRLATAEEAFSSSSSPSAGAGSFTANLSNLAFTPSNGVSITLRINGGKGWTARATHSKAKGQRCAIYLGAVTPFKPATQEGLLVCDSKNTGPSCGKP